MGGGLVDSSAAYAGWSDVGNHTSMGEEILSRGV